MIESLNIDKFTFKINELYDIARALIEKYPNEINDVIFPDEYWIINSCDDCGSSLGSLAHYLPDFQGFLNAYFVQDNFTLHNERRKFEHKVKQDDKKDGTNFHEFLDKQKISRNSIGIISIFEVALSDVDHFNIDRSFVNDFPPDLKYKLLNFDKGSLNDEAEQVKPRIFELDSLLRNALLWMESEGYVQILKLKADTKKSEAKYMFLR